MSALNYEELYTCLSDQNMESLQGLMVEADQIRRQTVGDEVYLRGLIEYSNYCHRDCFYCGLRRSNREFSRYRMNREQIVEYARQAYQAGFHSLALQSGELNDKKTVDNLVGLISMIKSLTGNDGTPGLGITLSVGELSYKDYERLFAAGAHRYLLRIETSNPQLFARLHPPDQSLQRRIECLQALKSIGYQVGTGIMIGLPGQSTEDLLNDLHFFLEQDIDMLGLGPYIPHPRTPLYNLQSNREIDPLIHTLKMMALARILMPDINMVASTALQSLHVNGLTWGLKVGANVVMPVITPPDYREQYSIYSGKQYKSFQQMQTEIEAAGYQVGLWKWGDPPHWYNRRQSMVEQYPL